MKFPSIVIAVFATVGFLSACSNTNEEPQNMDEQITIKTSIFPYEDWAKKIGGDYVDVENIVPIGADAHTYEPTPQEMIKVAESDVFIYNGAELEPFAESIVSAIDNHDVTTLEATSQTHLIGGTHSHEEHGDQEGSTDEGYDVTIQGIEDHYHTGDSVQLTVQESGEWFWYINDPATEADWIRVNNEPTTTLNKEASTETQQLKAVQYNDEGEVERTSNSVTILIDDHEGHNHGDEDPHVWLDPLRSIEIASSIRDLLVDLMPEQADHFNDNFMELEEQFHQLDEDFRTVAETADYDTFIVSHAGYGYWENQYGIKQIGIAGISPTSEPSQTELIQTVELASSLGLQYVLFEPNITPNVAQVVQDHLNADALTIHPLEALTAEDQANEADYFSLMYDNIETLETALND
ncbi:zinc ABC transporter, periplasmic-binding protein ZnuA [Bacillus sp. JCM 19045]|nr:zinc ABC transporter, periplasmic-binding protein ZnuA [Bacillus sp. JCM 19045]